MDVEGKPREYGVLTIKNSYLKALRSDPKKQKPEGRFLFFFFFQREGFILRRRTTELPIHTTLSLKAGPK